MDAITPEPIENYARSRSHPPSSLFEELARVTRHKTSMPQMQVGPLEGAFLRMLVRLTRARRVLEIGTFTGYSALAMAEALPEDGELVTLDMDPEATRIAREFWGRSEHGKKIRLILGPAAQTLETLEGPFDLVFIDADKTGYEKYWELCLPRVVSGGLIVADNVLWSGRVLEPRDEQDRAIASFNERVRRDGRVEAVMLPVRDGITLAWKF